MNEKKIVVSGVGCCLLDRIFNGVDFSSPIFGKYLSKAPSDGGLVPGRLEFEEEFERFAGKKFPAILQELTEGRPADCKNIGGPCIVGLINAAQLTYDMSDVRYYGCYGDDEAGMQLLELLKKTPVNITHYRQEPNSETPSTSVLSDPDYDNGHGERTFINTIGAAWKFFPDEIDEEFFQSDICVYGATALVPTIHHKLDTLIPKAKEKGALVVVTTVYDNINERKQLERWPLGDTDDSYRYTDLLVVDKEESLRLSGKTTIEDALQFFFEKGVGAAIVTNGAENVSYYANSELFGNTAGISSLPVSSAVGEELKKGHKGDTTGCGDNFAGGVLASLVMQMHQGSEQFNIVEACKWGIVSGGFTCFLFGGTYFESLSGEKLGKIRPYYEAYCEQIGEPSPQSHGI